MTIFLLVKITILHFCTFPDDGAERLYRRYGKKTEEYVQKHSLEDLDALIAETREVE